MRAAPPGTRGPGLVAFTGERPRRQQPLLEKYRCIFITMRDERLPTRQLWSQGGCILLCRLELPATDKCTRQINATHAHLASLTQAADGSTAGQPLPREIWRVITKKQSRADYILAKLPSKGQKMVIGNDSRMCLCHTNKCPASQQLAGWPHASLGLSPPMCRLEVSTLNRFKFPAKAVGTVRQMSLSRHS